MKLIFHLPGGKEETFEVKKDSITVGRGVVCDVVLPYEGFSRKHAQIDFIDGEIFVTDLGSTNGVFINGERIPPGQKKQMQTFLSLQIGPAQQVEILEDEDLSIPAPKPIIQKKEITRSHNDLKIKRSEQTRTTQMDPSLLRSASKKKENKKSDKKTDNKKPIVVVLLLVLAIAGYFHFMESEEAPVPETALEAVPTIAPLTETEFLSKPVLDSSYKEANCQAQKASWCEDGRVIPANKEGVVIEGKTLVVYLNMDGLQGELHSEAFNSLSENKRLEILALRRIFNSNLLRSFLRQSTLDTVQVVAGTIKEDQYSPFVAFKFKRDLDPAKIEKFYIFGLFDQVLNEGKEEALIDISMLYDKLDF